MRIDNMSRAELETYARQLESEARASQAEGVRMAIRWIHEMPRRTLIYSNGVRVREEAYRSVALSVANELEDRLGNCDRPTMPSIPPLPPGVDT